MGLRELTPEENAVLDTIFAQRCMKGSDIFEYDYMEALKSLTTINAMRTCTIDIKKLYEVVEQLSNDHIISSDYIAKKVPINPFSVLNGKISYLEYELNAPITPDIESTGSLVWAHQTEWAREYIQKSDHVLLSIEDAYAKIGSATYIRMTLKDIENIKKDYKPYHTVCLRLDAARLCLELKIDQEAWRQVSSFHADRIPLKVLSYAWKHKNKVITREELRKHGHIPLGKKYIKSQVFEKNHTVQELHPILLRLERDSIAFISKAHISQANLSQLKRGLKIA